MKKVRLDHLLVHLGLVDSREKGRRLILAGQVLVNECISDKPGHAIDPEVEIRLKSTPPFVSRGGEKLESCYPVLGFPIQDKIFMDVGSSTGGFTDFLLQNQARHVYAIDVGLNQLAYSLRIHPQVTAFEKTHICSLSKDKILDSIDGFTADVSFISLTRVIPVLKQFSQGSHFLVLLIKPQFEVDPKKLSKHGVVRNPEDTLFAIQKIVSKLEACEYGVRNLDFSKIPGPRGNVEYFIYAKSESVSELVEADLKNKVHEQVEYFRSKI
jgi:23S rRNA (cytidine1920-2'-O)/16S rRNA (cytidine1409-2'-O)-methyltransferase